MTPDDPRPLTGGDLPAACAPYADELAEVALGVSAGRERARALAHLEVCPRCRSEVDQLASAADSLLEVVPGVDPPVGFEVRLFDKLGAVPGPVRARRSRHLVRNALAAAASVVALSAAGVGAGWIAHDSQRTPSLAAIGTSPGGHLRVVALVAPSWQSAGRAPAPRGRLYVYSGKSDWIFMDVDAGSWHGQVACVATLRDGTRLRLGTFWMSKGYGAWGVALPVSASRVRSAQVVTSGGTVIATADLRTA